MNTGDIIHLVSIWAIPVLLAITLHEAAHGYVADLLGDDTARQRGRLSLNPLRHIDPFGTVLLPAMLILFNAPILFGYAKPVPVHFGRLRFPKRDMVLVALAGPGANLAIAIVAVLLSHLAVLLPESASTWTLLNLRNAVVLNLVLALFNMLPLPPLDGGRVLVGLLPPPLDRKLASLERYGIVILLALLFVIPLVTDQFGSRVNPLASIIGPPLQMLYSWLLPFGDFAPLFAR